MPELPEVETVRMTLKKHILYKKIKSIEIRYGKIIKNVSEEKFQKELIGQEILDVKRNGKYLLICFKEKTLVIHLRMEGKLFFHSEEHQLQKHDHIIFKFTDESFLIYNDTRKFGTMDIIDNDEINKFIPLIKLGKEPNDPGLTVKYLQTKIKKSSKKIKQILLDQTIINGLGNIYTDEILFASKINPQRPANSLSEKELSEIIKNTNSIIQEAIKNKGTTVKSFAISEGEEGNFQQKLQVYGRKGEKCYKCQTIIKKITINGRGTSYCPHCQGEI